MSLFLAVELVEPAALAAGCAGFFALEITESDLEEVLPRKPEVELGVGSIRGVVHGVKRPLLAVVRDVNLASSATCNSASRAWCNKSVMS